MNDPCIHAAQAPYQPNSKEGLTTCFRKHRAAAAQALCHLLVMPSLLTKATLLEFCQQTGPPVRP
jgi:hypothetical protein